MSLNYRQEPFEPKPKLLVVDDQPVNARILHELFRDTCDVYMVNSGEQAIAKCEIIQPDLILLDVMMPGMDGWETCRRLQADASTAHIPIIFVTGQLDEADEIKGFSLGAVDFIRKPINPVITKTRVNTHLQLKRQADLLRTFALVDGLTNIANRRRFESRLLADWLQAIRNKEPISLIMFDVDFFKQFNDTYGHQKGDECLVKIAQTLEACLSRPYDLVARYGGEEFVILLPQTHHSGAEKVAQLAIEKIAELKIPHAQSPTQVVSLSGGIATTIPAHQSNPQILIEKADHALYAAKEAGRGKLSSELFSCADVKFQNKF